ISSISEGRGAFCSRLLDGICELRNVAETSGAIIAGIGAGVPGLIGCAGFIYSSVNMRPLDGLNLSSYLQEHTGLPVACGNDANLIALGEKKYGAGRRFSSCMVITIGTGLGSGLILDGRLWNGSGGFASEFGHVTVKRDGRLCSCGNRGCLEQYVYAGALFRYARKLLPREILLSLGGKLDGKMVAKLAGQNVAGAIGAFEQLGHWLGIAIASLVNTLNLEAVIIGGGVAEAFDYFSPSIIGELGRRSFPQIGSGCEVVKTELGDDAGLMGAAAIAMITSQNW
ncbi:MAG: ROK family protein, partial [Deltaproteobacteria bacterium]